MERNWAKQFDWGLLLASTLLVVFGLTALYSATYGWAPSYFKRQLMWLGLSLPGAFILAAVDPLFWAKRSRWLYLLNVGMLLFVDVFGKEAKGAQRWLILPGGYQLQPSEFAKIMLIITLGTLLARMGDEVRTPRGFLITLLHIGVPALLIFKQPDLGTSIVVAVIWLGMLYLAPAKGRYLALTMLLGLLAFAGMWQFNILKDYQKARLESFINPEADPRQSGYHILQSRIAIGSGQFAGKGYMHGIQKELHYIPEQHTDFIFAVIGEEGGFAGSMLMLGLYAFFLTRVWRVMAGAREPCYRLMAGGILAMFTFHTFTNLAMTMGLFPVVGIPLPFISMGGSMLMVGIASVGLLMGIRLREEALRF